MSDHVPGDPVVGERGQYVADHIYGGIYLGRRAVWDMPVTLYTGHPTHPERVGRVWTYRSLANIRWAARKENVMEIVLGDDHRKETDG